MSKTAATVSLCLLLLTACSHRAPQSTGDYLLPSATQSSLENRRVRVDLANYLDQGGVVLQLDAHRYHVARQHRWAEPLAQQLQRALAAALLAQQWPDQHYPLAVTVSAFHGDQHGQAIIRAGWHYQQEGKVQRGTFEWIEPLAEDGYSALVQTLDQGLQALAETLATGR